LRWRKAAKVLRQLIPPVTTRHDSGKVSVGTVAIIGSLRFGDGVGSLTM
jgi:hypothetical protein